MRPSSLLVELLVLALGVVACANSRSGAAGAAGLGAGGATGGSAFGGSAGLAGGSNGGSGGTSPNAGGTSSAGTSSTGGSSASAGGTPNAGGASGPSSGGSSADSGAPRADAGNGPDASVHLGDFVGAVTYGDTDFAALQALGIRNVRLDRPTEALIEEARTFGIEALPIADYGFTDLSGQNDDKYPPTPPNRSAWAKRMVDEWRNMAKPPLVIEVWNEPWNTGFWKPQPDAAAYLELVKAFAAEAWAAWPHVTLLVSADTVYPSYHFRRELLDADTTGFLNDPRILPTTHNYVEGRSPTETTSEPCSYDLDRFDCAYSDFKSHGHPNPMVWVTEFGWETDTPGGTNSVTPITEALQATYTTDAFGIFHDSGHVAKAYAFMYHTGDPWNYNWLRPDGSQKPVCDAVKTWIESGK